MAPRVADFHGITISIYAADHNPPHVHVYYGDEAALVEIATGRVLAGDVPSAQLRRAQVWIQDHRDALVERWAELNP